MASAAAPLAVARSEGRRRGRALVGLALLVALGTGATLAALGAAVRTRDAFPDYLDRADVADLLVDPSLLTTDIDAALRSLPHVRAVGSSALLLAGVDPEGRPRRPSEFVVDPDGEFEIHGSTDGRFVGVDRPALESGRLPTGKNEVVVAAGYRDDLEAVLGRSVSIGDEIRLSFWLRRSPIPPSTRPTSSSSRSAWSASASPVSRRSRTTCCPTTFSPTAAWSSART